LVPVDYYGDIKYFFLHNFEDVDHLLVHVGWVHHEVEEGAIVEKGHWVNSFTGVESLQRLVGRIRTTHLNKNFVVEEICDSMLNRLRDVL
jgi:hypothetical protein